MAWQCALSSVICDVELVKKSKSTQDVYAPQRNIKVEELQYIYIYIEERMSCLPYHVSNIMIIIPINVIVLEIFMCFV